MDAATRRRLLIQSAICLGAGVAITVLGYWLTHGRSHVQMCHDGSYTSFGTYMLGMVLLVGILIAPAGLLLAAVKTKDKEFGMVCGLLYIAAGIALGGFSYSWFSLRGCPFQ